MLVKCCASWTDIKSKGVDSTDVDDIGHLAWLANQNLKFQLSSQEKQMPLRSVVTLNFLKW